MKMKRTVMVMLVFLTVILAACTPAVVDGMMVASGATLQSDKDRQENPEIKASDRVTLAEGSGRFALDLYRQLSAAEGNLFCSPYSISTALAMTYAGAAGTTAEQMAGTMHFTLPQAQLHPAYNWLEQELARRGKGDSEEPFRLHVANAVWGQRDYKFLATFMDTLAENYGAGLRIVDFGSPEESRAAINDWVSEQTEGRIEDLIAPGDITTDTILVLTNAIYFKAAWKYKFLASETTEQPFHLLDGGSVTVPMMRQTMLFGYADGEGYQAVELPYEGDELSMVILLPEEGTFAAFEHALDYETLTGIVGQLETRNTILTMPKFGVTSEFNLKETLSGLGMVNAFSPDNADFSGMTGNTNIWLDDVVHKAFVSVDENGTEAAAATGAIMVMSVPATVTVDRPFILLIRDIETGTILFMGRVLNPAV